jgi:uncharacterized protein
LNGGITTFAVVLGAGLLAGFVDAIVGGGGLIQLPALMAGYPGVAVQRLLGTNKLGSICGTTSAVLRYSRFVRLPWRELLAAAAAAGLAAFIGASCVSRVPSQLFRPLVPVLLSVVLVYVLRHKRLGTEHAPREMSRRRALQSLAGCFGIGLYDGFFGPGTGSFLMLLFIRVHGFDFLHAAAAARLVNVATNLGALVYFGAHGDVDWLLGAGLGLCNAAGSVIGTRTARLHGARFVRVLFIAVVVALIARTAWNALH